MDFKRISSALVAFAERHQHEWNELDGAQGDGDLGVTIRIGAQALADCAESCGSLKEWFETGGKALRKAAPSTMGILLASALIAAGRSMSEGKPDLSLADWAAIQQSMADEIGRRGGAKPGDKTVLDALLPAVRAFADGVRSGHPPKDVVAAAATAAKQGAEQTAGMVSRTGRSSWLGERAVGHIDGGAWVCFQLYEFMRQELG